VSLVSYPVVVTDAALGSVLQTVAATGAWTYDASSDGVSDLALDSSWKNTLPAISQKQMTGKTFPL